MHTPDPSEVFLALGSPVRLRVLAALVGGPMRGGNLAEHLGIPRGNLSNHLAELRAVGLIETERRGDGAFHSIAKQHKVKPDGSLDLGICVVRLGRVK